MEYFTSTSQDSISASETRFQIISNTVPGIVYQFTMNDKGEQSFPYVSPRIHELLGLHHADVMKDASLWVNQIHKEDLPNFVETVNASFSSLTPWRWEGRMLHINGTTGWFRGESMPQRNNDAVLWTGIVIDVTEAKKSEKRFHDISNTVPGIVYQFSINNKGEQSFPYVSPRIAEQIGLSHQDVMQDASLWINRIHQEDLSNFLETFKVSCAALTPWHWEGRMIHLNGTLGWFRAESIPEKNDNTIFWTGIIMNITEEHKAKEKLLTAHNELEKRVKDRTSELESAMSQAKTANNAKSDFLSSMSHELRTPLNAILGFAQLLKMDKLSEQQTDSINEILNAGNHLLHLVKDILDVNNIERGKLTFNKKNVNLNELISNSINLIKNQATKNNINIRNEITVTEETWIFTDPHRCKEVIINFLSNAIKYNKPNGIVTIREEISASHVKICVTDTGKGIEDRYYTNIFMPFERLGMAGSGVDGTGIGLSISKNITEALGGSIGFETTVGEGSTFWASFTK